MSCPALFLLDPYLGSDKWVWMSVSYTPFADSTDLTLADDDNNSITTDDANRAILGNVAMQMAPLGGLTNARSANCWPNLQPMQVANHCQKHNGPRTLIPYLELPLQLK